MALLKYNDDEWYTLRIRKLGCSHAIREWGSVLGFDRHVHHDNSNKPFYSYSGWDEANWSDLSVALCSVCPDVTLGPVTESDNAYAEAQDWAWKNV